MYIVVTIGIMEHVLFNFRKYYQGLSLDYGVSSWISLNLQRWHILKQNYLNYHWHTVRSAGVHEHSIQDTQQDVFLLLVIWAKIICSTVVENLLSFWQARGGWDLASVKTAMWAQGAISGCGAAGSDSKNMARRRQFKTTWFQLGFHTVLGNL